MKPINPYCKIYAAHAKQRPNTTFDIWVVAPLLGKIDAEAVGCIVEPEAVSNKINMSIHAEKKNVRIRSLRLADQVELVDQAEEDVWDQADELEEGTAEKEEDWDTADDHEDEGTASDEDQAEDWLATLDSLGIAESVGAAEEVASTALVGATVVGAALGGASVVGRPV